jgi:hypothetical protein
MAASKVNYLVVYKGHSQVYGCSSKKIALESAIPEGCSINNKKVLFITFEPDTDKVSVYRIPDEEVFNAEIKEKKEKKVNNDQETSL